MLRRFGKLAKWCNHFLFKMQVFNIFWQIFRDYNFNTDLLKFIKALKNKTIHEVKMFLWTHIWIVGPGRVRYETLDWIIAIIRTTLKLVVFRCGYVEIPQEYSIEIGRLLLLNTGTYCTEFLSILITDSPDIRPNCPALFYPVFGGDQIWKPDFRAAKICCHRLLK